MTEPYDSDDHAEHLSAAMTERYNVDDHAEYLGAAMAERYDFNDHAGHVLKGFVTHERLRPVRHAFRYPLFQVLCDLGRLGELSRWWFGGNGKRFVALNPRDFGPRDGHPLEAWMRGRLAEEGIPVDGRIWLQAIPRVAGYAFNPVSFWYCHDRGGHLRALYADVRNTFGAHHGYLLTTRDHGPIESDDVLIVRKTFHVSPFFDVDGDYAFRVQRQGRRLVVRIDYGDREGPLLRTAICMRAEPLTGASVGRALLAQPLGMIGVVIRIHWQAARLWLKRVPFHGKTPPSYAVPCENLTQRGKDARESNSSNSSNFMSATDAAPSLSAHRHQDHEAHL